jgi:hypothetical protein
LQVESDIAVRRADIVPHARDAFSNVNCEKRSAPSFQIDSVHPVNQRPLGRARPAARGFWSRQQIRPSFLDHPPDGRIGKGIAQGLGCWKRVNDVAHRAETDDEQTLNFRGTARSVYQDFLGDKRERIISLVE